MFRYENGWKYGTQEGALHDLLVKAVSSSEVLKFGTLRTVGVDSRTLKQLVLIYCIFTGKDMSSVLMSRDYNQYKLLTRDTDANMHALLTSVNPLNMFKEVMPISYQSNKGMQVAIFPALEKVYGDTRTPVKTRRGSLTGELALSLICDKVLFNPASGFFTAELDLMSTLETCTATAGIDRYLKHEDLPRLFILAEEIKAGYIPDDAQIFIADVRRCCYPSRLRDVVPTGVDYVKLMLDCPDVVKQWDFRSWLRAALQTEGITLEDTPETASLDEEAVVDATITPEDLDELIPPAKEESVPAAEEQVAVPVEDVPVAPPFMNPPEDSNVDTDSEVMHNAAIKYVEICGVDFDTVTSILQAVGCNTYEMLYRAYPVMVRRQYGKVDVATLTQYCEKLSEIYGDCALRMPDA